jgi:asparagine synthase (glutamine-hydrolysing)
MPGICGVFARSPDLRYRAILARMLECLQHRPGYVSTVMRDDTHGCYLGATVLPTQTPSPGLSALAGLNETLLISGECVHSSGCSLGRLPEPPNLEMRQTRSAALSSQLARMEGIFSGALFAPASGTLRIFVDRCGLERIFLLEAADGVYFASEAKALLRVSTDARSFDPRGLAQFIRSGCTFGGVSLYRGVQILPPAAQWTITDGRVTEKTVYFLSDGPSLRPHADLQRFRSSLQSTMSEIVPQHAAGAESLGISLTAGLDTRMVMTWLGSRTRGASCYTYSGEESDPLDARIAARVAAACGLPHTSLRLERSFFERFPTLADQVVYLSDGYFGVAGAHEVYFSELAQGISSHRLTGNYGSEVMRGTSGFGSNTPNSSVLAPDVADLLRRPDPGERPDRTDSASYAFQFEIPNYLQGTYAASRAYLHLRTPFVDSRFLRIAQRKPTAPGDVVAGICEAIRLANPALGSIATDHVLLGGGGIVEKLLRRAWEKATFKLDYLNNEGFPSMLSAGEPFFQFAMRRLGLLGRHKHLHYRSWFQTKLRTFVLDRMTDPRLRASGLWDHRAVSRVALEHTQGRKNHQREIELILTLEAVERLLLGSSSASASL